ncbi:MAG TPA: helix-turn-helix transcriptional regulator [Thermoanaerobaculia bacterium]|nr:helix-turn-helix transcriptional regulator [Thermoanaerobaculia bacterium]
MAKATLGEFEHQVLLAVLRLGGEAYSVPLVLELEERTGREVAQAAVFIALRRLEAKGLLTSRLDDHAVPETGRVRRYFKLTPAAVRRLKETRRELVRLWEGLDATLDGAR